jgi:hypothetical protein
LSITERIFSFSEFYTIIKYIVTTSDGYSIPNACFNPSLIHPMNSLCDRENKYLTQIPIGFIPSFIDLKGNYSTNFATIIISALQRMGIHGKGK